MIYRTLEDAAIARLTVAEINAGLRCYREDLRYSLADAERAAELWNASKASTRARVDMMPDGLPYLTIEDV